MNLKDPKILGFFMAVTMVLVVFFVYLSVSKYRNGALLWGLFIPIGIVLLLIFLIVKLRFRFNR
ncbi:MAG: hypothetical protein QXK37_01405 [Candidatus Woesearchaeota archaeon]